MLVVVEYITKAGEEKSFEYFSKFNKINVKGIKEEAKNKLLKNFGYNAKIVNILVFKD